jgi:two-component system nitrogen regulation sensor histidine kinase GlnL
MQATVSDEAVLENLEVAIVVIDSDRLIQRVNLAAETLFEQSRNYLIGKHVSSLIPLEQVSKCIDECQSHDSQFTLRELSLELPFRETLVDFTISSLSTNMGSQKSVLLEINSINRISRFMRENNQMERVNSFRLMMRGLAHEIKNPLGGIRGAAQLLQRELEEPDQVELSNILVKEADRLTRLVDRVMGSRESFNLVPCNIHEILEHVVELVTMNAENQIQIVREYDPTLPEIDVDREQMIQAVLNIVANAIEAQQENSAGAKIGLMTQFERIVTINQKAHRRVLKIRVWDEGPGVSSQLSGLIFDPLVTGKPNGSGLGLSITQEIVQRHEGIVQLDEYQGRTCFSIYLPYPSLEKSRIN